MLMLGTFYNQQSTIDNTTLAGKRYLYVYVCGIEAYLKVNENNQGECNPNCNYPCSYEATKDLGLIASESKLREEKAVPSKHKGCRILN